MTLYKSKDCGPYGIRDNRPDLSLESVSVDSVINSTGDAHQQIAITPFLTSHHSTVDVRNDGVGLRNTVLKLGNGDLCIHDTLVNV